MCNQKINSLKKKILEVACNAEEGHLGSSFSVLDILFILYDEIANISPSNQNSLSRDYIILSKGHASLGHAAVLENKGFITEQEFRSYCSHESLLGGHLSKCSVPGVEVSTGSLGHGVAVGVGIALSSKIKSLDNKVYIIVGDGEINEGTFWESLLLASHHNLKNLFFIIDYNRSNDRALMLDPLEQKVESFGCKVEIVDGHNPFELKQAMVVNTSNRPKAIIAKTIKGNGVKEMENNHAWHHRTPTEEDILRMIKELN
jgi:transketolase